ncbi:methylated-DNA--[protein]-cysteine S-methyltransferase [Streptosporangium lutulentum]|uniref:Methylated-DNA--protein-cysteine methyltransferase n=1 Tax=Streptosporangium lutulentum TaxID=1461250 RepID=A0ABT9QS75_9ACTN|nr:methylated-DNA--[protein]-cysteine S-methyltransferase [Streptosporangium lutulentum]MDP9849600.1 methylated-DNA-[protein]-cysteine S-methyltransferase [Streptosporangium lutulentum]
MARTHTVIASPLGDLLAIADDGVLSGLYFERHLRGPKPEEWGTYDESDFEEVRRQLDEYFAGKRTHFEIALAPQGNAFQQQVWRLLTEIPFGETRSYGDLARQLGDVALAQAVGAANARNPLSVIVPCHRVVGADGNLTGYAGGLDRKRFLLELEEPAERKAARLF